ncbi:MAG: hypothetical protein EPO16_09010 [Dehalococcoidia bacterium]|nr:MAG: hypothetical protein EPO16_09010 [Dehalococcoidia bacterium]
MDGMTNEHDDGLEEDEQTDLPSAEAVLEEIGRGMPLQPTRLHALSEPSADTLQQLLRLWPRLVPERRRDVLAALQHEAAEHSVLDFHRVYLTALRDADTATRMLAVRGLFEEERPEIMRVLMPMLTEDASTDVRVEVARALGQHVLAMEFGLLAEDDAEALIAGLRDTIEDVEQPDEVRGAALEALGASSEEATAELISEQYETGSGKMKLAALRAMGRNASDGWLDLLIYHFDDEDPEVRAVAAEAAGLLLLDEAVSPLVMLATEDKDNDVQVAAIKALGEIASDEAERILTRWQRERHEPHIREALREALGSVHLITQEMRHGQSSRPDFGDEEPPL